MAEAFERFGDLLRAARVGAGMTQEELAERSAVSVRGIQALETGERRAPQRSTLQLLVDALDLSDAERTRFLAAARRKPSASSPSATPNGIRPRTNLPLELTLLIGRTQEVEAIERMLLEPQVRLLTLTGPGGTGKTRLALHVARRLLSVFPGGVYLVPLASIQDPARVPMSIAQTLGVVETPQQPLIESIITRLGDGAVLLVLDNFEQIVDAAPAITTLLAACMGLKILVTSRVVLHLRGERKFAVAPLAVPDLRTSTAVEDVENFAAVELFVQRAQDVFPDFALTPANAGAVAEICARLDGLPLAIELAAARSNVLTPAALLARFREPACALSPWFAPAETHRLDLLVDHTQDLPMRQRTMRATLDWSYALLSPKQQILFRRLGVFAGSWTMEAAEAICDPTHELDVLTRIASLLDSSLLQPLGEVAGDLRFRMLEIVREVAIEQLQAHDEYESLQEQHAGYFVLLAERADPELRSWDQVVWLERLDAEHDNLRAALNWTVAHGASAASPAHALRLVSALSRFWFLRGHFTEWDWWLTEVRTLCHVDGAGAFEWQHLLAKALLERGMLALNLNDGRSAAELGTESLRLYRALQDARGIAAALVVANPRDVGRLEPIEEALALAREIGDVWLTAWILYALGMLLMTLGHEEEEYHAQAGIVGNESLVLAKQTGDHWLISRALMPLGYSALAAGDIQLAEAYFRESLLHTHHVQDRLGTAWTIRGLALTAYERGNLDEAKRYEEQRFAIERELGNKTGMADAIYWLARVALDQGNYDEVWPAAEQSLALAHQTNNGRNIVGALLLMGRARILSGDAAGAIPLLEECIVRSRKLGLGKRTVDALAALGWVALSTGAAGVAGDQFATAFQLARDLQYEEGLAGASTGFAALMAGREQWRHAAQFYGMAAAWRAHVVHWRMLPGELAFGAADQIVANQALGNELFRAAFAEGEQLARNLDGFSTLAEILSQNGVLPH